jgi:hypothetical protein
MSGVSSASWQLNGSCAMASSSSLAQLAGVISWHAANINNENIMKANQREEKAWHGIESVMAISK